MCCERRAERLSEEASRGQHPGRRATACSRRAAHDCLQVRRLEKSNTATADDHAPDDVGNGRRCGNGREQYHPESQNEEAAAAENRRRETLNKPSTDRSHDGDDQRPWRNEEPRFDLRAMQDSFEIEGKPDEGTPLRHEGGNCGRRRQREHRPHEKIESENGRRMVCLPAYKNEAKPDGGSECDDNIDRLY